ncbi:UTP--glucose-1-phosphate uridylyltransferase [Maritimibacter dapengensis]|uniref:UTP--glucose-1-phosphate uridylyltransferase n=1 Tax=Maritimibacter dapengensis TaxID=2836868 RepID=A0ABS6T3K5_9RHOB|nr:UTP--glucose-1-phosphate uridylyltransferase [Maritimibacter dapengensis]MBV7379843.1 UTP--glucose-1-phosphate uridylyltransferase [Maritimibacter dapengensis]
MTRIRKAVFPVAGLGTRFLPATKSVPKEMLPLIDRPLIQYAIDEARAAGIEEFIFVTAVGKGALEDYFDTAEMLEKRLEASGKTELLARLEQTRMKEGALTILRQDRPRGLGHAVRIARRAVGDEPFAVLLPDDVIRADRPALAQMVEAYSNTGGHMVATMEVPRQDVSKYGVLDVASRDGALTLAAGMVEKPRPDIAPSREAVVGRYILDPSIFGRLADAAPGAGGEIQLTDAINADAASRPIHGWRFAGERFDCGSQAGYVAATLRYALACPELASVVHRTIDRSEAPVALAG